MKHKTGIILLIIGGALMIISSAVGSTGIYDFFYNYVSTEVNPDLEPLLNIVITVIKVIADWGGGAIIFGAFLIALNQIRIGKWIVGIGLTFGSLAFIIWAVSKIVDITGIITDPQIIIYLEQLKGFFTFGAGLQFSGVTIAIFGRWFIKKPKKEKKSNPGEGHNETTSEVSEDKYCPDCGAPLPLNANFCNECGTTFDDR